MRTVICIYILGSALPYAREWYIKVVFAFEISHRLPNTGSADAASRSFHSIPKGVNEVIKLHLISGIAEHLVNSRIRECYSIN